jgi:predicted ATPase/class 3 adenylate cyclase
MRNDMTSRPTGTVTFLFTDIEGSTRLWEDDPDSMAEAVSIHDRLVRQTIAAHDGYIFSTGGDSFCAAFSQPEEGLAAAIGSQLELGHHEWPTPIPIRVRMALHSGTAAERDGDYFGSVPNRCARILAVGNGGQILLSEVTHSMVKEQPPAQISFRDMGDHRLRDLAESERVFAVVHPDFASPIQALRSLSVLPNNLPAQLTSFVGRDQELEEASKLLRGTRLLTIAGVGGSGKTRLSLQMAVEALDHYRDGVWLIELASVAEPEGVLRAVASSLGVRELAEQALEETLISHLRPRQLLLVLDNCEHIIDAAARLAQRLLAAAPELSILATSREMLGVPGEVPYQLRSMSVPDSDVPFGAMRHFDSVRLFAARGEAVRAGFRVSEANAASVVQLCRRLDGMPLAIELAAARLRVLAPEQIAARLDDRFRLLTGGSRTVLPRQQTLQATIDWSYDLLDVREKLLFERLSAFQGGFTLEAAEAVCAGGAIAPDDVLDLVSHLVDKSLLTAAEVGDGIRYRLLETLRQYGRDRLALRGETDEVRKRHALYFRQMAEDALPHLRGPEEITWLDRLETDHDNTRQALRWAIDANEVDLAQGLAGTLYRFWLIRSHVDEGRTWLDQVVAMEGGNSESRSRALLGAGTLALTHNDHVPARRHLEEALAGLRAAGDSRLIAAAMHNLAQAFLGMADYAAASDLIEEELRLAEEYGDLHSAAFALMSLGELDLARGDLTQGSERLARAVQAARATGSVEMLGNTLTTALTSLLSVDDVDSAERYARELDALGRNPNSPGRHLVANGMILARRGDVDNGLAMMESGISNFRTIRGYERLAGVLRGAFDEWAGLELSRGAAERAATLLGGAEQLVRGAQRLPHEQAAFDRRCLAARSALTPAIYEGAFARGMVFSFDELLDFLLGS